MSDYGKILMSTANAVGASLKKKMGSLTGFAPVDWAETTNKLGNKLPERTVSGAVCSFSDGADDVPMPSVKASITAVQAGSGDPSPSNVRAISGFAECDVTHTKKNVWGGGNVSGTRQVVVDCAIPAGTYMFSASITSSDTDGTQNLIIIRYADNAEVAWRISRGSSRVSKEMVFAKDVIKLTFYAGYNGTQSEGDTFSFTDIQIEVGSTATDYESYAGETIPVSFGGQTIYGGELNLTTGVLTVTHEYYSMAGFTSWTYYSTSGVFRCNNTYGNGKEIITCDVYKPTTGISPSSAVDNTIGYKSNAWDRNGRIYIKDTRYTATSDLVDYIKDHYIVLELSTPTTIQLTPEEVRSFLGMNNLWANTGDSEVTYFAQPNIPTEVLYKGQISTTSDYATANFTESVADDEEILVKVYCPARSAVDYKVIKVSDIGNGLNVGFNLHTTVNCTITKTSIASYQYSGDHYDIYADVLAYDSAIFN